MLIFEILIFGFALWLGAYLISRNPSDLRLILAGAGLITYAIGSPQAYQDQTTFREAANTASRQNEALDLPTLDDPTFVRLTRRALSHMANLPRLSASPLTRLPLIDKRLHERGIESDTLQRASELRAVLSESIAHLRPENNAGYGMTDPWRHYNALYYPYVMGLKPYSRRGQHAEIDGETGIEPSAERAAWKRPIFRS